MVIKVRFNGDLRELVDSNGKDQWQIITFPGKRSAKDLIQARGVPHTEIGKILLNHSDEIDLDYILKNGDMIDAYPITSGKFSESTDSPRLICDVHLWKLARRLRLLGFDTFFNPHWDDPQLAEISFEDHRILLTRDRGLLKRNKVQQGLLIRNTNVEKQVEEVLQRLGIANYVAPFSRCLICNSVLNLVPTSGDFFESRVKPKIPEKILGWCREFHSCPDCQRIFWKGSHYKKLLLMIQAYLTDQR